ncbi:MAG: hypothetical protein J0I06_24125 [Planctomycetes bacterium]|nr:hypothetical protein [Planctomycetota bacterium]
MSGFAERLTTAGLEVDGGEWRRDLALGGGLKDEKDFAGRAVYEFGVELPDFANFDRITDESPSFGLSVRATAANPYYYGARSRTLQLRWLDSLFPTIAPSAREPKPPRTTWPAPALALSRSLLRADRLGQLKGGVAIGRQIDGFDARRGELSSRGTRLELVSPTAWMARTAPSGGQVLVNWCDAKEYGTYTTAFQLGRVRPSNAHDLRQFPLELADNSLTPLHEAYAHMTPTVVPAGKDRELLVLKHPTSPDYEVRVLVDTGRHVALGIESRNKGKATGTTKFDDFIEVAGMWWAQRIEVLDGQNRRLWLTTQTISELPVDEFAKRMTQELAGRDKVLFLRQPLPSVAVAKTAAANGKATFDDRAVLTLHFAATQQWERAREHLRECEKLSAGKTGMRWLRDAFLLAARRHDELRKRLLEEATALATTEDADARANDHFLAGYLAGYEGQVLETNERLSLSDVLRKVYERQPAHLHAAKAWRSWRVSLLGSAGQPDKARQLAKELAADYPRDYSLQFEYALALVRSGDYPAAYAWLDRALGAGAGWEPHEEDQFRGLHARFLRDQGRYRDLADYLATWIKWNPEYQQPYAQYLSALVYSNQAARAEALAAQWLREALIEEELPAPVSARFLAARDFALGQGPDLYSNRVEERWHAPLAETALYFARRDTNTGHADGILSSARFTSTDAGRAVRKALAEMLRKGIGTLPAARVDYLVNWVWSDAGMERDDWQKVATALRRRWDAAKEPDARYALARPLGRVLDWLGPDEALPFLRVQFKEAPELYRAAYANELFNALLARPWAPEIEDEAFALLDTLAEPRAATNSLLARVAALHRLTDAMLEARFQARVKAIEHPEKLARTELQKKHTEARKSTREAFSDRLRKEAARTARPLVAWLVAERVWIDVRLDRDLKSAADDCWAYLATPSVKTDPEDTPAVEVRLDGVLRARFLMALENLAARKGADAALVDRLLKFVDERLKDNAETVRWRAEKFRLLIALDRVKDLEVELGKWVAGPDGDDRWRLALGYLLAEQGKVPDAIKQFEALEAADKLSPAAYRSLANWYLVENRRDRSEKARAAAYKTTSEYQLYQQLYRHLSPWQGTTGHLPTQLDPEVLIVFSALFEKSATPQSYLHLLQQFYQASRDFRLLSMLPDGAVGHTAGRVYPFLDGMRSVLAEVRDEATADELAKRIAALRPAAKTPVDQRAIDLLELLVERRAAEVQNQAGPHADKALAALTRAFKGEWSPGEQRLMADFLAGLGSAPQATIAKEQLRQLEALHRGAAAGSYDRLHIASRYAATLNGYSRGPDAIDLLRSALKEFEDANNGMLPTSANGSLTMLITFLERAGHYDRAEKVFLAQLKHPVHAEQRDWLVQQLNELYHRALRNTGDVSLGTGAVLYKALEKRLLGAVGAAGQDQRYRLLGQLVRTYRTAHELKLAGAADDTTTFAFKTLPPILKEQTTNYDGIVNDVAEALVQVTGPRDGIAFLLDRADDEPDRVRYTSQDAWSRHAYRLGGWRAAVKDLGDLEPRLLKFVLTELRRDLRSRESRSRNIYDCRHGHYWAEKEGYFARAAEEVLAERKASGPSAEYIAEYLFFGLGRERRAVEVLFAAHEHKLLTESGRWQLVDYLHRTQRYAESIALLLPLVEARPENLHYRTRLMYAYFRTEKPAELLALLKQTDAFFHEKDRWTETVLATLAGSCLETHLFARAAAYYEELVPRHQRANAHRGAGDGTLSSYYANAARAYAGLGKTKQAVDMACGAIVSWGPNLEQRKYAIQALVRVLAEAQDLDAYAAELDKEKLQSAVVRKAIGLAHIQKNEHGKAVPQLQLASELQPDDAEIYTALLACHDKLGDKDAAVRELLRAVELSRRDIKLYEQLGKRLAEVNRPGEAERAVTSIVEMLPNESESHALLAEIREGQKRWPEAIAHWERVAEIRALEPTGLLKLAAAQIELRDWDAATKTVRKLRGQPWPPRFSEVQRQIGELERKLDDRSKR